MKQLLWLAVLYLLGLAMIFFPHRLWQVEHFFTDKGGEPSELYLALMRLGGIVFLVIALGMTAFLLGQKWFS